MATVNKDFKIKSGLIVEGTTATVNGFDILTKKTADQDYIVGLIGGTATSDNTPNTVVKRNGAGSFSANVITADLVGDVTGTVSNISNHNTDDLSEGSSNKYFTNTRAQDALAGMYDPAGSASTAQSNAEDYADTVAGYAQGNAQSYADTVAGYAQGNAEAYADGLAVNYDAVGSAANALADANDYTDTAINGLSSVYDALGSANTAYNNAIAYAEGYTDNAVASLVDSAPALLDTLNELAAALQDNPNVIADLQDVAAGKQDTLTAGSNIDITGATISVTGLDTDDVAEGTNLYFSNARAVSANTGLWDTIGAAANAQAAAEDYADGLAANYDPAGSAANALADANSYTDTAIGNIDLTFNTDEISEGVNNLYFTDARAKSSAADLLTGASLTNITITGSGAGLTITAENGVADSDTDDLVEGSTNLYFSNVRAVAALEAVVPNFTAVELNSVAKQVAATLSAPTAGIQVAHAFAKADYRSAEYLVKVAYGTHTEISKVLLTLDSSDNIAITEYGIVGTNGSASSISAGISGNDVQLQVTTTNNNSTVTVVGTLLV